jgi:hypothetical protein
MRMAFLQPLITREKNNNVVEMSYGRGVSFLTPFLLPPPSPRLSSKKETHSKTRAGVHTLSQIRE